MTNAQISAGKLQIIGLAPLKLRLGPDWVRIAPLVHKLFEAEIGRAIGRDDRCVEIDELTFGIVFSRLCDADAKRVCTAISVAVCRRLFGEGVDDVIVRSLIAGVSAAEAENPDPRQLDAAVEARGRETIVGRSANHRDGEPLVVESSTRAMRSDDDLATISAGHELLAADGLRLGLFPVWDLRTYSSSSLFVVPFKGSTAANRETGHAVLLGLPAEKLFEAETALLAVATAYAHRLQTAHAVCAVGVGVGYDTLSQLKTRIAYITRLQRAIFPPAIPLLLKIERIPFGTLGMRIRELVAMLRFPNIRVLLELERSEQFAELDAVTEAAGIGITLDPRADAALCLGRLASFARTHRVFTFVDRLDTPELLRAAQQAGIRFGTGLALGLSPSSGLEDIPLLPLRARCALHA